MFLREIILKENGFSLAEIMVAAGMLGVLALGTMQISKNSMSSLKRSEASLETQQIINSITQNLLNGESCRNTLTPVGNLSNGANVPGIRNRVNNVIFNTTDKYGGNAIKIDSMRISDLVINAGYGELAINIRLERLSSQIKGGGKFVSHSIPLKVEVNGSGQVTRCYAATENAIDTAKIEACDSIGGIFIKETSVCDLADYPQPESETTAVSTAYLKKFGDELPYVKRDGDTMTGALDVKAKVSGTEFCVGARCRNFVQQTCAPGQLVKQVNEDGSLICQGIACPENRYFEGFNASGQPICKALPTGTCATNQYIKQINADGSVVCGNVPYHWGVTCSAGQYIERIASNGTPTCKALPNPIENISCSSNQFIYRHSNGVLSCRAFSEADPTIGKIQEGKICRAVSGKIICDQNSAGKITTVVKRYSATGNKDGGYVLDINVGTYDFCALSENRHFDNASSVGTATEGCLLTKSGNTWLLRGREADPSYTIFCGVSCFDLN